MKLTGKSITQTEMTKGEFAQRCSRISAQASRWAADTLDFWDDVGRFERPETIFRFTDEMRLRLDLIDERAGRLALSKEKT